MKFIVSKEELTRRFLLAKNNQNFIEKSRTVPKKIVEKIHKLHSIKKVYQRSHPENRLKGFPLQNNLKPEPHMR